MLAAVDVSVRAAGHFLLESVTLELNSNELVAIVGPNGAGKSTLLKVLCGDLTPDSGGVTLEGKPLNAWRSLEGAKKRAVLPQESSLAFPFTAFEVALMGRSPHVRGAETVNDYAVAEAALQEANVSHLSERDYPTLSGGEKQRVQLARILAQVWEVPTSGYRYLLLDEPTSSLDLAHQHQVLTVAKRLTSEGVGILAVLHDLNLAAQYADRLALLCKGRVFAVGTPENVLKAETLCAAFQTPVVVMQHPCLDCPLVVSAIGAAHTEKQFAEKQRSRDA